MLQNLVFENMGAVATGVNTINIPGDKDELFKQLFVTGGTTNVHAFRGHEIDIDTLTIEPKSHVVMVPDGGIIRVRHLEDKTEGKGLLYNAINGGKIFIDGLEPIVTLI